MIMLEKVRKGIHNPRSIPPFLRNQLLDVGRKAATRAAIQGKPLQGMLLDDLRAGDDWLLIVLDACRYREFAELAPKVFDGDLTQAVAEGRNTFEYVRLCWPDTYPDVTYVSGAVPINSTQIDFDDQHFQSLYDGYVPKKHIGRIVDAWSSQWDMSLGVVPAWGVTEEAMKHLDTSQLVVHYFQPHAPYIGVEQALGHHDNENAKPNRGEPIDAPLWQRIKRGEISNTRLRELYQSNLELALAEAAKLVEATTHDRIVVIADHGEALGEWNVYSHPRREHPKIRIIPWLEVEGLREGWEEALETPKLTERKRPDSAGDKTAVQSRLEELGYL